MQNKSILTSGLRLLDLTVWTFLFLSPLSQEPAVDRSAQYQHLTNMELISLLLQQEMDMQKQQAASEQQEAQLYKCEAELRKVKLQVRDLEDYIDNLLLRIMEQTPTLLQVRTRHKWRQCRRVFGVWSSRTPFPRSLFQNGNHCSRGGPRNTPHSLIPKSSRSSHC